MPAVHVMTQCDCITLRSLRRKMCMPYTIDCNTDLAKLQRMPWQDSGCQSTLLLPCTHEIYCHKLANWVSLTKAYEMSLLCLRSIRIFRFSWDCSRGQAHNLTHPQAAVISSLLCTGAYVQGSAPQCLLLSTCKASWRQLTGTLVTKGMGGTQLQCWTCLWGAQLLPQGCLPILERRWDCCLQVFDSPQLCNVAGWFGIVERSTDNVDHGVHQHY